MTLIKIARTAWHCAVFLGLFSTGAVFGEVPGTKEKVSEVLIIDPKDERTEFLYFTVKNGTFVYVERFGHHADAVFDQWRKRYEQMQLPQPDVALGPATARIVIMERPGHIRGAIESSILLTAYGDVIPLARKMNDSKTPLTWVSLREVLSALRAHYPSSKGTAPKTDR